MKYKGTKLMNNFLISLKILSIYFIKFNKEMKETKYLNQKITFIIQK